MNKEFTNIQFKPLQKNKYAKWFEEVHYNGTELSDKERKEYVTIIDETIEQFTEGLPLMHKMLDVFNNQHDNYHQIYYTITSVMLFVLMTMIDCLVSCNMLVFITT